MQRLFNLDKWQTLGKGQTISFEGRRPRNVRLEVNAPVETALQLVDDDGTVHFLALVKGRDTVEFGVKGKFHLMVEGEPINVYTADGADIVFRHEVPPVIFTKIVERRRRNPELERIQHVMTRNMEKRLEQMQRDFEQRSVVSKRALSEKQSGESTKDAPKAGASESDKAGTSKEVPKSDSADKQGADDET